jgi:hypothetical protein
MKTSKCFLLVIWIALSFSFNRSEKFNLREKSFDLSATKLIKDLYCEKSSFADLIFDRESEKVSDVIRMFQPYIAVQINSLNNPNLSEIRKRTFNVFILESFEGFETLLRNIKSWNFDTNGFFTVMFATLEASEINRVFSLAWKNYFHNFNVILMNSTSTIWTFMPFQQGKCNDNRSVSIEFKNNFEIFPNKINNLHKCPLRVPRVKYYPSTDFIGNSTATGIEGEILMTIKNLLNFTLQVLTLENEKVNWGKID